MTKSENQGMEGNNKLVVIMVVNGAPKELGFPLGQKLRGVVEETLSKTGNTGQTADNWDIRNEAGEILNLDKHLGEYSFPENVKLFLNPKRGIGG